MPVKNFLDPFSKKLLLPLFICLAGMLFGLSGFSTPAPFLIGVEEQFVPQAVDACYNQCGRDGTDDEIKCIIGADGPRICNSPRTLKKQIDMALKLQPKMIRLYLLKDRILKEENLGRQLYIGLNSWWSNLYQYTIDRFKQQGIPVLGTDSSNPKWMNGSDDVHFIPCRFTQNGSINSSYIRYLQLLEKASEKMAKSFPDILYWESGNEPNGGQVVSNGSCPNHPNGQETTKGGDYTFAEKAAITVDIMFYTRQGLKKGNSNVFVFSPGLAPYGPRPNGGSFSNILGIKTFLELIYQKIESNEFPTGATWTNRRQEFYDGLAWHPYCDVHNPQSYIAKFNKDRSCTETDFIDHHNQIFALMNSHGDGATPVYFSEFGVRDYREAYYDGRWNETGQGTWTKGRCKSSTELEGKGWGHWDANQNKWVPDKDKWGVYWQYLSEEDCQITQNENANRVQSQFESMISRLNFKPSIVSYYRVFDLNCKDGRDGPADPGTSVRGLISEATPTIDLKLKPAGKMFLNYSNTSKPLPQVTMITPINKSGVGKIQPLLKWKAFGYVEKFILEISLDPNFSFSWKLVTPPTTKSIVYRGAAGGWTSVNSSNPPPDFLKRGQFYYLRIGSEYSYGNKIHSNKPIVFKVGKNAK